MEKFFAALERDVAFLQREIKTSLSERDQASEHELVSFTSDELSLLRKGLTLEEKARKNTDSDILAAMSSYTQALHRGLQNFG